jgi:hypothetical protein
MNRMNSTVVATIVLVAIAGLGRAVDQPGTAPKKPQANQPVGNSSQREADYLAAVKNCGRLEPREKQQCIESAKERFGEMLR